MTEKTQIEVALLLPSVPDARDACVQRLGDILSAKEGIETAHLVDHRVNGRDQICIHYDPNRLSIGEIRDLAGRAGAELEKRFGHVLLNSETMDARQARLVESRTKQIAGVLDAAVSPTGVLSIEFDRDRTDEKGVRTGVRQLGVRLIEARAKAPSAEPSVAGGRSVAEEHEHAHGGLFGERTELTFAVLCGGLLLAGWLVATLTDVTPWAPWSLYLAAYIFGGYFTFREATASIRAGRFEIDLLMLVAAGGAAVSRRLKPATHRRIKTSQLE